MADLYLGDVDEDELLGWLCENISPLVMTTKAEFSYFNMYHGDDDLWIMETSDVSDVRGSPWDTMTRIIFLRKDDAMLSRLRWGGTLE
jgi:hypothetical protein